VDKTNLTLPKGGGMRDGIANEPVANLLDYEPELFLGATSSEVGWIVGITCVSWLVFFLAVFLGVGLWLEVMSVLFAAIPATAITTFGSVVVTLKRLQKAKMNRPQGYFDIIMTLRLQRVMHSVFGTQPHFETYTGIWGIDRYE
jgi:conjugative transfer region protein (TIGR03750 family)